MNGRKTLAELFAEEEAQRLAEANTPERIEADELAANRASERHKIAFARGVELGWFDEDGNTLGEEEAEEEEEEDD